MFMATKPSSPLVLFLLLASSFMVFAVVAAPPAAHAQSVISITTSDGSTVCAGSLGGTWNGTSDACNLSGTLTISSGTTLDIGSGVSITATDGGLTPTGNGINNAGTINNNGSMSGTSSGTDTATGTGISNSGTINNNGSMSGTGTGTGISNSGTINNSGTISGTGTGGGFTGTGTGISNGGTINNSGSMSGAGTGAYDTSIYNAGTINNVGTMDNSYNAGTINLYCGAPLSSSFISSIDPGTSPHTFPCYTVIFDQGGIPTSGVTWGVTVSWGPFVLPVDNTGTGGSISVQATGSLTYSYDTFTTSSGVKYSCSAGCTGTALVTADTSFVFTAGYAASVTSTTTSVGCTDPDIKVGSTTPCGATVTGYTESMAGELVTFSQSGGAGTISFPSGDTCKLITFTPSTGGSSITGCGAPVTVEGGSPGRVTLEASYPGDSSNPASKGTTSLTVTSALSVGALSATHNPVDVGQATTISTSGATGGTGTYTYAWTNLPSGCGNSDTPSVDCTPAATTGSPLTVSLTVTDGNGDTATATLSLAVDPALDAAPSATPNPVYTGGTTTLSAGASGGSGTYASFAWSGLPSGCSGSSASFSCAPTSDSGSPYTVQVVLTDTNGNTVTKTFSLTVYPPLSAGTIAVSPNPADVGQSVTFTASPSGGSGIFSTYTWSGLPEGCTAPNSATVTCTPGTAAGSPFSVSVSVTDSNGGTATSSALSFTVDADPTVAVTTAGPLTYGAGQPAAALSAAVTYSGFNTASVEWYSSASSSCSSSSLDTGASGLSFTPGTASTGTTYYCAVVSDSGVSGYHSASNAVEVVVSPASPSTTTALSSSSVVVGSPATDTASLSNGYNPSGTITFTVYSDSACTQAVSGYSSQVSVSGNGPYSSAPFTPTSAGTYYWTAAYSGDHNNNPASSACGSAGEVLTVIKASPTLSTSASPASMPFGGSASDAASLSGGYAPTGTVTYSVYSDNACQSPASGYTSSTVTVAGDGQAPASGPFTASAVGTYYWRATYSGDANNNGFTTSCGATGETLTVNPRTTSLTVYCPTTAVNQATICTVDVADTDTGTAITPTGTVDSFSDGGAGGTFGSSSCILSSGSCTFTYTPAPGSAGATITISAKYEHDSVHQSSSGSGSLVPTKRTTSNSIACPTTPAGIATTCTVTVTDSNAGTAITPTGTVDAFSDGGAGGTFGSASCSLSSGECTFTYTPPVTAAGTTITISATYEGDSTHLASSGASTLTVETPAQAVQALTSLVGTMNLPHGTGTSLVAKLNAALNSINSGNNNAAINQLSAFINEVNARSGKAITPPQAQMLTADAQAIIAALS